MFEDDATLRDAINECRKLKKEGKAPKFSGVLTSKLYGMISVTALTPPYKPSPYAAAYLRIMSPSMAETLATVLSVCHRVDKLLPFLRNDDEPLPETDEL